MSAITSRPRSQTAPSSPGGAGPVLGDQRIVIRGVGRHVYECLSEAIGEGQHIRLAYDGRDLELMTTGHIHERYKELLGQIVSAVTLALDIDRENVGETTWDTAESERGLQADLSYYFDTEKLRVARHAFARKSNDPADFPNPDLAIEIDLSRPKVDRPSITRRSAWSRSGSSTVRRQSSSIFRPMGPTPRSSPAGSCRSARRTSAAGWSSRTRRADWPGSAAWANGRSDWVAGLDSAPYSGMPRGRVYSRVPAEIDRGVSHVSVRSSRRLR